MSSQSLQNMNYCAISRRVILEAVVQEIELTVLNVSSVDSFLVSRAATKVVWSPVS